MRKSLPGALAIASMTAALVAAPGVAVASSLRPIGSAAELVAACRALQREPESAAAGLCRGYLLGYLEASPEVIFEDDLPSSYMQRVLRTRAPDHPDTRVVKEASYCLEDEAALARIARDIAAIDPAGVSDIGAADIVERVLQADFRCSP